MEYLDFKNLLAFTWSSFYELICFKWVCLFNSCVCLAAIGFCYMSQSEIVFYLIDQLSPFLLIDIITYYFK